MGLRIGHGALIRRTSCISCRAGYFNSAYLLSRVMHQKVRPPRKRHCRDTSCEPPHLQEGSGQVAIRPVPRKS